MSDELAARVHALNRRIKKRLKDLEPQPLVCATCRHKQGPYTPMMATGGYFPSPMMCEACGGTTWAFTAMTSTYDEADLLSECQATITALMQEKS